ncbi:inosine/uridine-preferring nucleoside hydrolase [Flagelloscypha sp. PMI_526]|nr:inosine/uridine-preferring nucleoside hydrolase [Flagelloscypha sp. PMI_526]
MMWNSSWIVPLLLSRFSAPQYPVSNTNCTQTTNLIVDTDLFSDVDDAAALLLAATQPCVRLLGVQLNWPSSYSVLAASSILSHYGHEDVPIGAIRPLNNSTFFDSWFFQYGEYASKVQHHWPHSLKNAEDAWDPVTLYRKLLASSEDRSVVIASIGFLDNLSSLLTSSPDGYSALSGISLVRSKVSHLYVMGGEYPSGWEWNFAGVSPSSTVHALHNWPGNMSFIGLSLGFNISTGARLTTEGPKSDPVVAAYQWYNGYNENRYSWDPLTILVAIGGTNGLLSPGNTDGLGRTYIHANGSNEWINDGLDHGQHWLRLNEGNKVNETVANLLDEMYLRSVRSRVK